MSDAIQTQFDRPIGESLKIRHNKSLSSVSWLSSQTQNILIDRLIYIHIDLVGFYRPGRQRQANVDRPIIKLSRSVSRGVTITRGLGGRVTGES